MKADPSPCDADLIQQLVDDELDDASRHRMLRHLDEEAPEHWRDVALGLLEARLLTQALRHRASALPGPGVMSALKPAWPIAAALMLGMFLGFHSGPKPQAPTSPSPPRTAQTDAPHAGDELHYQTALLRGWSPGDLRLPILQPAAAHTEPSLALGAATSQAQRLQQAFTERGIQSSLETSYLSALLEDGRQLLIPVSRLTTAAGPSSSPDHSTD